MIRYKVTASRVNGMKNVLSLMISAQVDKATAIRLKNLSATPPAGVAVYERGSTGKLHAARIDDDVDIE